MKDVLPIIESKLKHRKSSITMLWICSYWRKVLKDIISKTYPLVIRRNDDYSFLFWHTIICELLPYECPLIGNTKNLIFSQETDLVDFNVLPRRLEGLSIRYTNTLNIEGEISNNSISQLALSGNFFPYSLITSKLRKLEFSSSECIHLDFGRINAGKYTYIHMKRNREFLGNISLLSNSYQTLKCLTINLKDCNDLRMFQNLEKLEIGGIGILNEQCLIDISLLPKNITELSIGILEEIRNERELETFQKIKKYRVSYNKGGKVYFPPNAEDCEILSNKQIQDVPKSVKRLKCCFNHTNKLQKTNIETLIFNYNSRVAKEDHIFDKLPSTLKHLEIQGRLNNVPLILGSNIVSLKISCETVSPHLLPPTLQNLYIKKINFRKFEGKKPKNIKVIMY
jgi:hypothetical protein